MRRRSLGRRLLGLLLLLVVLELALQAAGPLLASWMTRRDGPPSPDAPLTVLCVGDSNTYGLHLPRPYAYPALLAAQLDARFQRPVTVVNRGVPGQNSAMVATHLAADLDDVHPDVVVVLVGINDTWNTNAEDQGLAGLLGRSKLVRLTRVLLAGVTTAQPFEISTDDRGEFLVDRGDGAERVNPGPDTLAVRQGSELDARLRGWLGRIVILCRDWGAVPILMTYPEFAPPYDEINAALRAAAADGQVALVDNEVGFGRHFAERGYAALMFNDHHPSMAGYQLIAEALVELLEREHLVPPESRAHRAPELAVEPSVPPELRPLPGRRLRFTGPAGRPYQILVGQPAPTGGGFAAGATLVPLVGNELIGLSRLEPSFSGSFPGEGTLEVDVPAQLHQGAGEPALHACLLVLLPPGQDGLAAIEAATPSVAILP